MDSLNNSECKKSNWNYASTLKLIESFKTEPVLWNTEHRYYRNYQLRFAAWVRIKNNFGWPDTVRELDFKMRKLIRCYNKYLIESKQLSKLVASEDIQPKWYAFATMHGFLGQITTQINEEAEKPMKSMNVTTKAEEKVKMPKLVKIRKNKQQGQSSDDEYDRFGKLIAIKIKKLPNPDTQERVMLDIHRIIAEEGILDRLGE
ncbi:hypothetical protein evm_005653 [Chilo suppressalis]|nr:hypothetical protein evm_005653 [Chilo suppressalis]